eukprot:1349207-Rhodomonas_salina.1
MYVPAGQLPHSEDPLTAVNVPAGHAVHWPQLAPMYPALHRQSVNFTLPTDEKETLPAGHVSHTVPPLVLRNFPVSHATHCDEPLIAL